MQDAFRDAVGDPTQAQGAALQGVFGTVTGLADGDVLAELDLASHPVLTATDLPAEPDALVGADNLEMLGTLSAALRDLVVVDSA